MRVRVYLKSGPNLDIELKEGVKFSIPKTDSAHSVSALLSIGENDQGTVYFRNDDILAIVPRVGGGN